MEIFNVNGASLAGEVQGSGELLVLVHGAVGDYRSWEGVAPELAKHYRVLTYSRRWHYPNSLPSAGEPYTQAAQAADLAALLKAQNVGPVRLLAHSYGASACAEVAVSNPELVRSMVLAEPSLFGMAIMNPIGAVAMAQTAASTMHVVPLLRKGQTEKGLSEFLKNVIGKDGCEGLSARAHQVMRENIHTLEPMLNGMNSSLSFNPKQAARIQAPTLLVEGEHTTTLFRTTMKSLANNIPNSVRAVIPNLGHVLHLEDPAPLTKVALEFFAKH